MKAKTTAVENKNIAEPSVEMSLPDFVTPEDVFRKQWASSGADWAYFILQFLRGRRRLEIQPKEIAETQLYLRSSEQERRALAFVCATDEEVSPSPEDTRALRTRDQFVMDLVMEQILGMRIGLMRFAPFPRM
jgi:hypothetical protein